MNVTQQEAWQRRILKEVLSAIMQDTDLRNALGFLTFS